MQQANRTLSYPSLKYPAVGTSALLAIVDIAHIHTPADERSGWPKPPGTPRAPGTGRFVVEITSTCAVGMESPVPGTVAAYKHL